MNKQNKIQQLDTNFPILIKWPLESFAVPKSLESLNIVRCITRSCAISIGARGTNKSIFTDQIILDAIHKQITKFIYFQNKYNTNNFTTGFFKMDTHIRKSSRTTSRPIRLIEVLSRNEALSKLEKKRLSRPISKGGANGSAKKRSSYTQTQEGTAAAMVDQSRGETLPGQSRGNSSVLTDNTENLNVVGSSPSSSSPSSEEEMKIYTPSIPT